MKKRILSILLALSLCLMLLPTVALAADRNIVGDIHACGNECSEHSHDRNEAAGAVDAPIDALPEPQQAEIGNLNSLTALTMRSSAQPASTGDEDSEDTACSHTDHDEDGKCDSCGAYLISTVNQLKEFAVAVNNGTARSATAVLMSNITVNPNVLKEDGTLNDGSFEQWTPIGTSSIPYTGTFDGNGKTISGLYYDGNNQYVGLFGCIEEATIKNVTVTDSYFKTTCSANVHIGGVVGCAYAGTGSITIVNCHSAATIIGRIDYAEDPDYAATYANIGGVVGYAYAGTGSIMIEKCGNTGTVTGTIDDANYYYVYPYVGGIVGYAYAYSDSITITGCNNKGNITSTANQDNIEYAYVYAGGMVGYAYAYNSITIKDCENSGEVKATADIGNSTYTCVYVGGMAGYAYGYNSITIRECENSGEVKGTADSDETTYTYVYAGGMAGYAYVYYNSITIKDCENSGDVTGTAESGASADSYATIGGMAGWAKAYSDSLTITACSNEGEIISEADGSYPYANAAGMAGYANGSTSLSIEKCENSGDVSAKADTADTTYDGDAEGTYVQANAGGAVAYAWSNQALAITECSNSGAIASTVNSGTSEEVYAFVGGMAGYIGSNTSLTIGECENSGNVAGTAEGKDDDCIVYVGSYAGGMVGAAYGGTSLTIRKCENSGNITGTAECDASEDVYATVGGMTGWAKVYSGSLTISACSNAGKIISEADGNDPYANAGGMAGYAGTYTSDDEAEDDKAGGSITIENCKNIGAVSAKADVANTDDANAVDTDAQANAGGVVGCIAPYGVSETGALKCCFNAGNVTSTVSDGATAHVGGVLGTALDESAISFDRCYYKTGIDCIGDDNTTITVTGSADSKTAAQFASGEVAYLLNGSTSKGDLTWYQTIGTDNAPTLDSTHGTVYLTTGCVTYCNTAGAREHEYKGGVCKNCGAKEPSTGSGITGSTTTTTNPDGSTTTTTTNKVTGTVTETTTTPNGTTSTTVTDKNGNSTTTVSVSKKDAQSGETITLPVDEVTAAGKREDAQEITVSVPSGGATVEIPVKNPTPGTVIVIVDKNGNETVVPGSKVTEKGVTVTLTESATIKVIENSKDFSDVKSSDYFGNAADWASSRGITGGTSANTFSPDDSCTRAQLVTFLWRAAGCPTVDYTMNFTDVGTRDYFAEAVRWAASLGIVDGYGNGLFGSGDPITREQMAVILYRYARAMGMDTTQGGMAVREFKDYDSISGYAIAAVQWAVNAGIMQGANGYLMPQSSCTRAQIVTMLYRLLK